MLQQFILDWKLHKKSFFGMQLALLGAFALGFVMVLAIMNFDEDPGSWFCMGTLLAAIALCFTSILAYGFGYFQEFQLALSMGRGRMAFLGAYVIRLLLHFLLGYAIVLGLYQTELAIYPVLFPQYDNEIAFSFLYHWKVFVPVLIGVVLVTLFLGSLYGRYGKKGMIVFYVLWIFCCFILPRMVDAEPTSTGALDVAAYWTLSMILAVPVTVWLVFGIALAVCMIAVTIRFAQTQAVK